MDTFRIFLGRDGHRMSVGRAYRLWRAAGLQLPRKRPRKHVATRVNDLRTARRLRNAQGFWRSDICTKAEITQEYQSTTNALRFVPSKFTREGSPDLRARWRRF